MHLAALVKMSVAFEEIIAANFRHWQCGSFRKMRKYFRRGKNRRKSDEEKLKQRSVPVPDSRRRQSRCINFAFLGSRRCTIRQKLLHAIALRLRACTGTLRCLFKLLFVALSPVLSSVKIFFFHFAKTFALPVTKICSNCFFKSNAHFY